MSDKIEIDRETLERWADAVTERNDETEYDSKTDWVLNELRALLTPLPARDEHDEAAEAWIFKVEAWAKSGGGVPGDFHACLAAHFRAVHERMAAALRDEMEERIGEYSETVTKMRNEAETLQSANRGLSDTVKHLLAENESPTPASPDDSGAGIVGAAIIKADSLVTAGASTAWRGLLCNELVSCIDAARARDKARIEELERREKNTGSMLNRIRAEFDKVSGETCKAPLPKAARQLVVKAATDTETIATLRRLNTSYIDEAVRLRTQAATDAETIRGLEKRLAFRNAFTTPNTPAPPSVLAYIDDLFTAHHNWMHTTTRADSWQDSAFQRVAERVAALDLDAARKASEASEAVVEAARRFEKSRALSRDETAAMVELVNAVRALPAYKAAQEGGE